MQPDTHEILLDNSKRKNVDRAQRPELANALAYMSGHLAERIHLRDLCRAAGVSPRTLGYLFLKTYGETPMAYLKRRRLNQARRFLLQARPAKKTVAEIARSCGFNHMSQFALDYRKAMGERPSETLHQPWKPSNSAGKPSRRPCGQE
ncbi:MAG TPA: helix-turn-helix domain-containing protein [Woeseiaceae bacterium]|nr:helix-turn-helix domain-containing protein [Woeseiaceae bacterium]